MFGLEPLAQSAAARDHASESRHEFWSEVSDDRLLALISASAP